MAKHLIILCIAFALSWGGHTPALAGEDEPEQSQGEASQSEVQPAGMIVERTTKEIIIPKDPLISSFLSLSIPGLGQIYSQRYLRGVLFFGAEIICFITAGIVSNQGSYEHTITDNDGDTHTLEGNDFDSLNNASKAAVISSLAVGIGLHIWNVIDAHHVARDYNRKAFQLSESTPAFSIGIAPDGKGVFLNLSQTFPSP